MGLVGGAELERLRGLDALQVLRLMADHTKIDETFVPTQAVNTRRVHVSAAGADWELIVDGPKFFDTRANRGGGGAIDLVMHVWRVPFRSAVQLLTRYGA